MSPPPRDLVERAFRVIAGPDAPNYRLTTDGATTKTGLRFTWERTGSLAAFQPTVDIVALGDRIVHVETHRELSEAERKAFSAEQNPMDTQRVGFAVLYFGIAVGAAVLYLPASIRRRALRSAGACHVKSCGWFREGKCSRMGSSRPHAATAASERTGP